MASRGTQRPAAGLALPRALAAASRSQGLGGRPGKDCIPAGRGPSSESPSQQGKGLAPCRAPGPRLRRPPTRTQPHPGTGHSLGTCQGLFHNENSRERERQGQRQRERFSCHPPCTLPQKGTHPLSSGGTRSGPPQAWLLEGRPFTEQPILQAATRHSARGGGATGHRAAGSGAGSRGPGSLVAGPSPSPQLRVPSVPRKGRVLPPTTQPSSESMTAGIAGLHVGKTRTIIITTIPSLPRPLLRKFKETVSSFRIPERKCQPAPRGASVRLASVLFLNTEAQEVSDHRAGSKCGSSKFSLAERGGPGESQGPRDKEPLLNPHHPPARGSAHLTSQESPNNPWGQRCRQHHFTDEQSEERRRPFPPGGCTAGSAPECYAGLVKA